MRIQRDIECEAATQDLEPLASFPFQKLCLQVSGCMCRAVLYQPHVALKHFKGS